MHWSDLKVWKKSHNLVKDIYKLTSEFPEKEKYGLISQLNRATISIPTNIVEGFSRDTTKEYIKFLYNSRGSLEEVRYLLLLSKEFNFCSNKDYNKLESDCSEVSKMLNSLISSLKKRVK
jgi:four helix bundle protein